MKKKVAIQRSNYANTNGVVFINGTAVSPDEYEKACAMRAFEEAGGLKEVSRSGKEVVFRGRPVQGQWSDGWRTTTFAVEFDGEGGVRWAPVGKSRTPHWGDVAEALRRLLPTTSTAATTPIWEEKNCMGVKYACARAQGKKISLGVSTTGALSSRGDYGFLPMEVVSSLLPHLG